uniref:Uncharacterized protein n=1 Tax=Arundo donax TaxID=35708 RepID=A0A0A9GMG3_ARUDO
MQCCTRGNGIVSECRAIRLTIMICSMTLPPGNDLPLLRSAMIPAEGLMSPIFLARASAVSFKCHLLFLLLCLV